MAPDHPTLALVAGIGAVASAVWLLWSYGQIRRARAAWRRDDARTEANANRQYDLFAARVAQQREDFRVAFGRNGLALTFDPPGHADLFVRPVKRPIITGFCAGCGAPLDAGAPACAYCNRAVAYTLPDR